MDAQARLTGTGLTLGYALFALPLFLKYKGYL